MTKKEFENKYKESHQSLITHLMKHGNISRDDAYDVAQMAALKCFKYLILRNKTIACSFKTFIFTIARNELVNCIRSNTINNKKETNFSTFCIYEKNLNIDEILKPDILDECYDNALNSVGNEELCKLLLQLKEKSKTYFDTVCLYLIHEKDYKECAEILKIPIGTVKSRIFKARQYLRENALESFKDFHNIN